jgi:macrolide transport system ATP-binding/permease protein
VRWGQELADAALATLSRPVRSGLVLLAYLLGVAALVGAVGLAQSATGQIVDRLTDAASNQVMVSTSAPGATDAFLDPTSTDGAVARASALDGVTLAVPVRTYGAQSNPITRAPGMDPIAFSGRIVVTQASYLSAFGYRAASGSFDLLSNTWGGADAVLGADAAASLGVGAPGPGVQLWIAGSPIDVVGVLAPTGDALADATVFASAAVVPSLTNISDAYILVMTQKGFAEPLAAALPLAIAPQNPGSVQVSTVSQLASLQAGINSDMSGLLGVLAWVILALSALTAATTMFLSVQHRGPQIALRRAMGASRASVWRIFTYEGVLVGVAGGSLGALVGAILVWIMARHYGWTASLGAPVVLLGLAAGLVAGVVASAVPAVVAARRDPAQILRAV